MTCEYCLLQGGFGGAQTDGRIDIVCGAANQLSDCLVKCGMAERLLQVYAERSYDNSRHYVDCVRTWDCLLLLKEAFAHDANSFPWPIRNVKAACFHHDDS